MKRFVTVSEPLLPREVDRHEARLLAERTDGVGFGTVDPDSFPDVCRRLAGDHRNLDVVGFFASTDSEPSLPRAADEAGFGLTRFSIGSDSDESTPGDGTVGLVYAPERGDRASRSRGVLALVQLALRTRSDPWRYLVQELQRGGLHTWAWQEWYSGTAAEAEAAVTFAEQEFRSWEQTATSAASEAAYLPDPPVAHADLDLQDHIPDRPTAESPVDWTEIDPRGWTGRRIDRLLERLEAFRADLRERDSSWYLEPPTSDHENVMQGWLERLNWRLQDAQLTARDAEELARQAAERASEVGDVVREEERESGGGLQQTGKRLTDRLAPLANRVREAARALAEWKAGRWKRLAMAIAAGIGVGAGTTAFLLDGNRLLLGVGAFGGGLVLALAAQALHVSVLRTRQERHNEAKKELSRKDRRLWEREAGQVLRDRVAELRQRDRGAWSSALLEAADQARVKAGEALDALSAEANEGTGAGADPVRQRRGEVDPAERDVERLARETGLLGAFTFWTEELFEYFGEERDTFDPGTTLSRLQVLALFRARSSGRTEPPEVTRLRSDLTEGTMKDLSLCDLESPDLTDPVDTVVLAPGGGRYGLESHMVDEPEVHAVDDAVLAVSFFELN